MLTLNDVVFQAHRNLGAGALLSQLVERLDMPAEALAAIFDEGQKIITEGLTVKEEDHVIR